jgi:hypothetical protein
MLLACLAALATLASTIPVMGMMWQDPGGMTVRAIGIDNEGDNDAHVMVYPKWPGFLLAAGATIAMPLCVVLAAGRRRRPRLALVAYVVMTLWLARFCWGFAGVLMTFGPGVHGPWRIGVAVSALAVIGGIIGIVRCAQGSTTYRSGTGLSSSG